MPESSASLDLRVAQYYPHRQGKNTEHNRFSQYILDLKLKQDFAVNYFFRLLHLIVDKNIVLSVVPSSSPQNINSGITKVASLLSRHNRVNAVYCLKRLKQVEKKSFGGNRDLYVDLNSIVVTQPDVVRGRVILLLDDVITTGNSLKACERLLSDCGAQVVKFALGKTNNF